MRSAKTIATALVSLCLFGATVGFALADGYGGDRLRVVGLSGAQTLQLMNGPGEWTGLETELPFDARDLRTTGAREGHWLQVNYRSGTGYDVTGWADAQFLARERGDRQTVYRLVAEPGTAVPLLDETTYNVRAYIPASTAALPACGPCQNGYCQVRFPLHRGSIDGFVAQGYLEIPRPAYSGVTVAEQLPVPEPNYAYAATPSTTGYVVPPSTYYAPTPLVRPTQGQSRQDEANWQWWESHKRGWGF
jgi:hypothetical protein